MFEENDEGCQVGVLLFIFLFKIKMTKLNYFYDVYGLELDEILDTHLYLNDEPTYEQLKAIEMNGEDEILSLSEILKEYQQTRGEFKNTILEERVQKDGSIRVIKFYGEEIVKTKKKLNKYQAIIWLKIRIKEINQDLKTMVNKWIHKPEVFRNLKLEMFDLQNKLEILSN